MTAEMDIEGLYLINEKCYKPIYRYNPIEIFKFYDCYSLNRAREKHHSKSKDSMFIILMDYSEIAVRNRVAQRTIYKFY